MRLPQQIKSQIGSTTQTWTVQTPYPTGQVEVYSGNIVLVRFTAGNTVLNPNAESGGGVLSQAANYVGLGQSATVSRTSGLQAASGFGDNRVQQWVPGMATVTVTVSDMVVRWALGSRSYESLGLSPDHLYDILGMNTFQVEIIDMKSGNPLKTIVDCIWADDTLDITKHAPLTVNVTFNGLDTSGLFVVPSA